MAEDSSIFGGSPLRSKYLSAARTFSLLSLSARTRAATSGPFLNLTSLAFFSPAAGAGQAAGADADSARGIGARPNINATVSD